MPTNEELHEVIRAYIRDNLTISVDSRDFTDPNNYTIEVKLEGDTISTAYFNVTQCDE